MKSPAALYPTRVITNDPGFPLGKPRDEVTARDPTATPVRAAWLADVWGWQQALLASAGLDPDAANESITGSQLWTAMLAGHGVLSSRDPRWAALLVPGDDFDGSEALNLMAAELEAGGTLLILPAAGEATVEIPLVDTLSVPAGATVVLGPGVTLVAGSDEANTPAIELAAGSVLLGPGTVNCAADTARKVVLSGSGARVEGVVTSSAVIDVTGSDCVVRDVIGTGALELDGARGAAINCVLSPTIINTACAVGGADVSVIGGAYRTQMTPGNAINVTGDRCAITGAALRCTLAGAFGLNVAAGADDVMVSGCAFAPGLGAAVAIYNTTARLAGCAGVEWMQEPVRAHGRVASNGTLSVARGVDSVTKSGTGQYDVVFATGAVASDYYSVTWDNSLAYMVRVTNKTSSGFRLITYTSAGTAQDNAFDFAVLVH